MARNHTQQEDVGQLLNETGKSSILHAEFAQALGELSRGENAAATLERNLAQLEKKLDEILASFETTDSTTVEGSGLPGNGSQPT
ncbi:hypothetical protein VTK73DRAFT_5710 [Phialemonium thermophilum]|uniref:Uncharacterized protein n=1 Tax=Phialemonium thermophilum TaxID=223376 RepID=A0ABR3XWW6_9PEZI